MKKFYFLFVFLCICLGIISSCLDSKISELSSNDDNKTDIHIFCSDLKTMYVSVPDAVDKISYVLADSNSFDGVSDTSLETHAKKDETNKIKIFQINNPNQKKYLQVKTNSKSKDYNQTRKITLVKKEI